MHYGSHPERVAQPTVASNNPHVDWQQADWWRMDDWVSAGHSCNNDWTDGFTDYPSFNSKRARDRSIRGYNRRRAGSGQRATAYRGFFRALGRLRDGQF